MSVSGSTRKNPPCGSPSGPRRTNQTTASSMKSATKPSQIAVERRTTGATPIHGCSGVSDMTNEV